MAEKFNHEEILSRLAKDDQKAFEELFDYYYSRLFYFAKKYLKSEEGIDDILQDVFLTLWRKRNKISGYDTFDSYLYKIVHNLLLNELRRRLNNQKKNNELLKLSVLNEHHLSKEYDYEELKERIFIYIEELPVRQREIFKLSRIEGLSHKEIAKKLHISTKTVEYHIRQAINILKERLKIHGLLSLLFIYLFSNYFFQII